MKPLLALPIVLALLFAARKLAARSNTQVNKINQ
jgi:hypothetical protein